MATFQEAYLVNNGFRLHGDRLSPLPDTEDGENVLEPVSLEPQEQQIPPPWIPRQDVFERDDCPWHYAAARLFRRGSARQRKPEPQAG